MVKEMIKERFGEGLEKAKEFVKDNQKELLVVSGIAAITLLSCRKIEKNAFEAGARATLKETAALRSLGREVLSVAPKGDFWTSAMSAKVVGNRVDNLDKIAKILTDPDVTKEITGVMIISKA